MLGIIIIIGGFIVAYHAGGFWWAIAVLNAWAIGVMFNFGREERAPRWTGIAMPLTAALFIRGVVLIMSRSRGF